MNSKFLKTTFLFLCLLPGMIVFSQNVIIDYQAWNPQLPPCDIFNNVTNVPATINLTAGNISHQTQIGDVTYSNSDKSVQLQSIYVSAISTLGTKYKIVYSFKQGYTYVITVNAAELNNTNGNTTGPNLRLDLTNNSGGGSTVCNGPESINPDLSGNPAPLQLSNIAFADFQFIFRASASSFPFLAVSCIPSFNGGTNSIRIHKITITETPPPFNVTLIPPYTSCGSNSPITFTINNPSGATGVTGNNWDLGSASNNWLYNGSPAPQYIPTGATNTLSLTPVCGKVPSSVSGSVILNGSTINTTNSGSLSYNPLSLSINGTANLCSGNSNYFINGLPCNANVTWSLSPSSGVVSASCLTCNQTTLTRQAAGTVTINAAVTNACGLTVAPLVKTISTDNNTVITGNYQLVVNGNWLDHGLLDNSGNPKTYSIPATQVVQYGITLTNTGLTNVSWTVSGACSNITSGDTYFNCTIPAPGTGASGITVNLHATGPCGTAINNNYSVSILAMHSFMAVSPNPATNSLNISVADNSVKNNVVNSGSLKSAAVPRSITEIRIYDNLGNLKKIKRENKTKQATVNLTGLKAGVYNIEIFDGTYKENQQVIIQK